ncbi:co-chaperone GroES [Candidatus Saccharibacteria bacterium]|nr:co-chaperone GroES [Candidatus Saccharibacteria bacterium]
MTLKPLTNHIVAKKEKASSQTTSGLFLPDTNKEEAAYAVVESVGPEVKNIKKSDKIIYKEYSTTNVKIGDETYIIVEEKDVLATVEK